VLYWPEILNDWRDNGPDHEVSRKKKPSCPESCICLVIYLNSASRIRLVLALQEEADDFGQIIFQLHT
jgi:hypothetical protein